MTSSDKATEKNIRRRQPEQVRERVLKAAFTVFAARGFEGATMQQVADIAEASLPLIVYHFKSKEKLWRAVIEYAVEQFDAQLEKIMLTGDTSTATEQLKSTINAIIRISAQFPEFRRMLATEAYTLTPRLEWIGERFAKRHHQFFTQLIERAQAEGSVIKLEPHRLSFLILSMATTPSYAAEYQYLTGLDPLSPEEIEATIQAINSVVFTD